MIKLTHFSEVTELEQLPDLESLTKQIQIIKNETKLSAEEILKKDFDAIELAESDFSEFLPLFPALNITINKLGVADTLVRLNSHYQPFNLLADAVYRTITDKVPDLKISTPAIVVGEYDFVLAMTHKLSQSGFLKVIISLDDLQKAQQIKNIIEQFVFGMQVVTVSSSELTQLDSVNGLLITNFDKQKSPEAHESITYFNFLIQNAVFVDLKSAHDSSLVEEARRADLFVIDESQVFKTKYLSLLELFKISSFV